ncbi:protein CNPPD1-like [Saccostrea cucullata]|uniref:protein CNPPD1-like n=1 Tax=Saccostrea cuccullata TaxID=36930 RepID=UPI002ED6735A
MSAFHFPFLRGHDGYNDFENTELQDHEELSERLRKTLYYGKRPTTDRPSLPLTNLTVDFLNASVPKKLGKIDHYFAASSARHSCMSPCSMMMGMIYVNRLKKKKPDYMQQVSSSDLFLISMMMASKFLYDEGVEDEVFNDEWAASADLETEDINEMERKFLSAIDWQLYVNETEFYQVLQQVERRIALNQGLERGWFSYTDLWAISQDPQLLQTFTGLSALVPKMLAVSMVAYVAGLLTVVGSTLLVTTTLSTLATLTPIGLPVKEHSMLPTLNNVPVSSPSQEITQEKMETVTIEENKPKVLDGAFSSLWTLLTLPSILSLSHPVLSEKTTGAKKSANSDGNSTGVGNGLDNEQTKDTSNVEGEGMNLFSLVKDIVLFTIPDLPQTSSNQMVCAKGPCLFSGQNINCKNVSTPQGNWLINSLWTQKDYEQRRTDTRCKHCEAGKTLDFGRPDRFCDTRETVGDWTLDGHLDISCCCDHVTADLDRSLVMNGFADISLGFRTMLTPIPLFGT